MCKISGIVANAREKWTEDDLAPVINHSLNAFGTDRVMFAGDCRVYAASHLPPLSKR